MVNIFVHDQHHLVVWLLARLLASYLVSFPDRFFPFFVMAEKRVWWISIGRFVQQTPRFWESLIGVDNFKGLLDEVSITIVSCSYRRHQIAQAKLCKRNPLSLTILLCAFQCQNQIRTAYIATLRERSIRFISLHQHIE